MARPLSILLALASWGCSAFALLVGLFWGLTMKCGDSCSTIGGWRHDPDAWQWRGLAALGVLAFVCGAALFFAVLLRRPVVGAAAVVVGGAASLALMGGLSSEWVEHLDRRSLGEVLLMLTAAFAPILAVLLSIAPRNVRT